MEKQDTRKLQKVVLKIAKFVEIERKLFVDLANAQKEFACFLYELKDRFSTHDQLKDLLSGAYTEHCRTITAHTDLIDRFIEMKDWVKASGKETNVDLVLAQLEAVLFLLKTAYQNHHSNDKYKTLERMALERKDSPSLSSLSVSESGELDTKGEEGQEEDGEEEKEKQEGGNGEREEEEKEKEEGGKGKERRERKKKDRNPKKEKSEEKKVKEEEKQEEKQKEVKIEEKKEVKIEDPKEVKIEEKKETKIEEKKEVKTEEKKEVKIEEKKEVKIEEKKEVKIEEKKEVKIEDPKEVKIEEPKEVKIEAKKEDTKEEKKDECIREITQDFVPKRRQKSLVILKNRSASDLRSKTVLKRTPEVQTKSVKSLREPDREEEGDKSINTAATGGMMTLGELVRVLTDARSFDSEFRSVFFLTLLSFATPMEVLNLLRERYNATEQNVSIELTKTRLRVVSVVKYWVEERIEDLLPTDVSKTLFILLEEIIQHHGNAGKGLKSNFENRRLAHLKKKQNLRKVVTQSLLGITDIKWDRFDEKDFAISLTLYEFKIFESIQPVEFLSWNKKNKTEIAVNIQTCIRLSTLLSAWITSELVKTSRLQERVKFLKKCIVLGESFLEMNNFSSVMSVMAGLNSSSSRRMKKSWAILDESDFLARFEKLEAIMSHNQSYATYRAKLQQCSPPCLPYIGVYLTDLTFIEEGNADHKDGKVNFNKKKLVAQVLQFVRLYQNIRYSVEPPVTNYVGSLLNYTPLSEEEMYKQSKLVEPKDAEEGTSLILKHLSDQQKSLDRCHSETTQNSSRLDEWESKCKQTEQELKELKVLVQALLEGKKEK